MGRDDGLHPHHRPHGWLFGMAVPANSRFKDYREMIAFAKANPGRVSYSTSGIATTNHLAMEDIAQRRAWSSCTCPSAAPTRA
jgi:tripartite-type tricarboxylate transporter receptor subunit TctC